MSDLDAQTILNLTAALAHHLAADYARRYELPLSGGPEWAQYEAQLTGNLAPGVVAFITRLSAAVPADYDLLPALKRLSLIHILALPGEVYAVYLPSALLPATLAAPDEAYTCLLYTSRCV